MDTQTDPELHYSLDSFHEQWRYLSYYRDKQADPDHLFSPVESTIAKILPMNISGLDHTTLTRRLIQNFTIH